MSYRPDYDIARHGEHKSYALQSERGFAPVGRSDLFAAQLGQPDVEDCSNGVIPDKAEPMDGKKKIHVPVLTTMNKVLFDHYRLSMYTYVNRLLRSGTLSRIVGARVLNRVVNREVLSFPSVSFWRIDRTNFYADVRVQLKLKTEKGSLVWIGYLVLWCAFNAEFECGIEELTDEVDRKADGYDPLDSHLIPYHNNRRVDAVSEGIWGKYLPEAIDDPQKRNPIALAEKMGLTVKYYDADYVKQTRFYLSDLINKEQMDELEAKTMYIQSFPKTFKGAIELLKKQNKVNNPMLAEYLNMDDSAFARSLSDPRCYTNPDYLTLLCLYFKLPDWLSRLVFKRANVQLDEDVKRNQALLHILRVQSNDGVDAANEFLARSNLEQLKI